MNIFKKTNPHQNDVTDGVLEDKIEKQAQTLDAYKDQLKYLNEYRLERNLYTELSSIFACSKDFDTVFKRTLETLSEHLKAKYCGIFLVNEKDDTFSCRFTKGYAIHRIPSLPVQQCFMRTCLYNNEIIWEPSTASCKGFIPLNQDPEEYNVLCSPIILMGKNTGVIRLANIDPSHSTVLLRIMQTAMPLLCTSLERLILQNQNESTLRSLDASFSIARLLENTLDRNEIVSQVCGRIHQLFKCHGSMIALHDPADNTYKPVVSCPKDFNLTGNAVSGSIYLRNLLEQYPKGACFFPSIHKADRIWSWPDQKIQSLCMVPLTNRDFVNGVIIAVSQSDEPFDTSHTNLLGIIAAQTSLTLERASYFALQESLAKNDGLTGLLNRRMFNEFAVAEYNRFKRYHTALSIIMIDIDHFKKINDQYGHPVGDEVIKMVAETMRSLIRTTDRAFRYGGEEFAVLLPETSAENSLILAERIRSQIETSQVHGIKVTISLGVTGLAPSDTLGNFISRADSALYSSKQNGRNRVTIAVLK